MKSSAGTTIVAAGIVRREFTVDTYRHTGGGQRVLVTKRPKRGHLAGLWEFPGGKVEPGEDPRDAVTREILEECGIEVQVDGIFEVTFHAYPEKNVLLLFFACSWAAGEVRDLQTDGHRWLTLEELDSSEMPAGDVPVLAKLWQQRDTFFRAG